MKFIAKQDDEKLFFEFWQQYQKKNISGASYDVDIMGYYLITEDEYLIRDESFVFVNEEVPPKCIGICFFPIYKKDGVTFVNSSAPLASSKKYLNSCFQYIDTLISKYVLDKVELSIDVNYSQSGEFKYNYLRDYGYIDCTTNDSIFILNDNKDKLFYKLNRSSRKLIKKFSRIDKYRINLYNEKNITTKIFNQYKECHYICAGKQTRSDESFNYMLELIKKSNAILLELCVENRGIGYLLVFLSENKYVTLSSISNLPEFERDIPIYRLLYWKVIELFYDRYEIIFYGYPAGNSRVEGFKSYMNVKQVQIAKYKKYMGGVTVPHFKGIKYINKALILEDIEVFAENIERAL